MPAGSRAAGNSLCSSGQSGEAHARSLAHGCHLNPREDASGGQIPRAPAARMVACALLPELKRRAAGEEQVRKKKEVGAKKKNISPLM
jgi:hypothetical protein